MLYTQSATSLTPALVVYLIDASHSMNDPYEGTTKIEMVNKALRDAIKGMLRRSMRDGVVQRRYKLAVFAYSTVAVDVLEGIQELPEVVKYGLPAISAGGETDTAIGFLAVEKLLQKHLTDVQDCPAPL